MPFISHDEQAAPEERLERGDRNAKYQPPAWVLSYFPQLVIATLIGMGIAAMDSKPGQEWLIWTPPAGLVIVFLYAFWPRAEKKEMVFEAPKAAVIKEAPKPTVALPPNPGDAVAEAPAAAAPKVEVPVDPNTVLVLWGSETGTAEGLADMTAERLNGLGIQARSVSMEKIKQPQLAGYTKILVLTSTWGDGDPPSNGIDLWEAFEKGGKVDMSNVKFSVLALGDTAYVEFCKCGKDFDGWFEENGGKRIYPRIDCDLSYEANFEKWYTGVSQALQGAAVA